MYVCISRREQFEEARRRNDLDQCTVRITQPECASPSENQHWSPRMHMLGLSHLTRVFFFGTRELERCMNVACNGVGPGGIGKSVSANASS